MRRLARLTAFALVFCLCACRGQKVPSGAELVFDVDFSPDGQKINEPPKTVEPGKTEVWPQHVPSAVFFGHPMVVERFCGLEHQPLRLTAATGDSNSEGVVFSLDPRWGQYHFELDLCVNQLDVADTRNHDAPVVVFLDMINAHAIGLDPAGQIVVTVPSTDPNHPALPQKIGSWLRRKPVHVAVDVDFEQKTWRIALDGKTALPDTPISINVPGSMRVMVRGNSTAQAAVDNVLIWGQHDRLAGQEDSDDVPETPDEPETK
ncbi:MAG TPA: hypothetical protein VMR86_07635 [Myxococcota bacterium]|nr:hypothetical protein [Myxococcota bacterium]